MPSDVFALTPATEAFFASAAWKARRRLGAHPPNTRRMRLLEEALAMAPVDPGVPVPEQGWGLLADVIRDDRPLVLEEESQVAAAGAGFHAHLDEAGAEPARALAARMIGWGTSLLDLGGGYGTYARAFEAAGGRALVIERPEVIARAPGGVAFEAGDLFSTTHGGFDLVLLCNVLHLYGASDCARLCARARSLGRTVVVKDLDRASRAGVWFSLNMALFTDEGEVHRAEDVAGWLGGTLDEMDLVRMGDHLVLRTPPPRP